METDMAAEELILSTAINDTSKEECKIKECKKDEADLYSYTKLNDFTSEIFKIELANLPTYVGYGQLRKLLNVTMELKPRKVKAIGNPPTVAFVTFKNEEDRDKALKALDGHSWRGKTLHAKLAKPAADPMAQKRKTGDSEDCSDPKRKRVDDTPVELRLKNAVTPYWNVPYEEQLKRKQDDVHKFLMKLSKGIEKVNKEYWSLLRYQKKKYSYQCCKMNNIQPSPVTTHYRNKCEFTCGRHLETKDKTVGFRLNLYKEGSLSVAEPDDCINISKPMLQAVKSFETYIRESELDVYNPENHTGYWRQLTVRTSNNSDILLIVIIHPQSLSNEELEKEKLKLKVYFEEGPGSAFGITSMYFQLFSKKAAHEEAQPLTHLMGKKFIEETLLETKFQVSPEAFFQINVPAAEILYTLLTKLVKDTPHATVLDVCCGTGTISISLAKAGLNVIGIEMCPEAVENARLNAKQADLSNVEFVCGKAEDVIIPTLHKINSSDIIAVVDPPRAGLHQKVLKAIRASKQISTLIYVSCNPTAAYSNFVDLCRTPSNNYKGNAFYPVSADVVDMFPYTPHKELILVFKRSCDIDLCPKDTDDSKDKQSEKKTSEKTNTPEPANEEIKAEKSDVEMKTEKSDVEMKTEKSEVEMKTEPSDVEMNIESSSNVQTETGLPSSVKVEIEPSSGEEIKTEIL